MFFYVISMGPCCTYKFKNVLVMGPRTQKDTVVPVNITDRLHRTRDSPQLIAPYIVGKTG